MVNSKDKGNTFERTISRQLSLWWSNDQNKEIFWRSNSSGGMATTRTKAGKTTANSYGDISALSSEGEPLLRLITLELKRYGNLDLMALIDSKSTGNLGKFWSKLSDECIEAAKAGWGSEPWLIIQRNNRQPLIFMNCTFHLKLVDYLGSTPEGTPMISIRQNGFVIRVVRLKDFLSWARPEVFQTLWNLKRTGKAK